VGTALIIGVLCVLAARSGLKVVATMRARTAAVKAKSHWLWLGAAALVAVGFAARH
jgi:hypothetical protein